MLRRYIHIAILFVGIGLLAACSHVSEDIPAPSHHVLAGEWQYIDDRGTTVRLILDENGNGHYDWKRGRFESRTLIDHTWSGRWVQDENDREGGFIVEFSTDFTEGEGQWWYSRIGKDTTPPRQGGRFRLKSSRAAG